jgi:hypothetical protein
LTTSIVSSELVFDGHVEVQNRSAARIVRVLIVGYLSLGRSFAYLGIHALKLFIGDAALAGFLILKPGIVIEPWLAGLISLQPFGLVAWTLLAFISYGLVLFARGLSLGYPPVHALENLTINIYPLYLYIGLYVESRHPGFLQKLSISAAWWTGIYGVLYLFVFSPRPMFMPGTNVLIFGQPVGCLFSIFALLALSQPISKHKIPLGLNLFVVLANQIRSEWVGLIIGVCLWSILTRRLQRLVTAAVVLAALLAIGLAFNLELEGPRGTISSRNIIGRALAPFDKDLATTYTPNSKVYAGTSEWRKRWWRYIWASVHSDFPTALFGLAYGFPISFLDPSIKDESLRTPHNVFYYVLGYGGWFGVAFFFAFQASLLWALARAGKYSVLGVMFAAGTMGNGLFGNIFETPFGAIPFYLICGLCLAGAEPATLALREKASYFHPATVFGSHAEFQPRS